jgi:hypothetical protein
LASNGRFCYGTALELSQGPCKSEIYRPHIFAISGIEHKEEMNSDTPRPDGAARDLESALGRGLAAPERAASHATLRLNPVVLPPPPGEATAPAEPESDLAADDIDLGLDDDASAKRRQLLLAAAGVAIAIAGGIAWLLLGQTSEPPPQASIPVIRADPAAQGKAPPPAPPVETQAEAQAEAQPADKSMGAVSTELVPPTTEGLTPARKVNAVRIIVEGDQEVRPLR